MEPDILQTAKAAAVNHPVPDIQTLQKFIPLNNARLAYQVGNYQESIAQAQVALSLKADPARANWGIGISYGRLGQWDQAIASLQSALAIDKNFADAETALKWVKDGLKVAKKGKLPKEPTPHGIEVVVCYEDSFPSASHPIVPHRWADTSLFSGFVQNAHDMVARPIHRPHVDRPILFRPASGYELGRSRRLLFLSHSRRLLRLAAAHAR